METKWKTRVLYVDIDNGEYIDKININNYVIIKTNKYASVQNGHGTIEYTNECRRIYRSNLFGDRM